MFREPDEIIAQEAAAKLDRIAANRRSPIRREASIRPHRPQERARDIVRLRNARDTQGSSQEAIAEADRQEAELEAAVERLRQSRMRLRATRLDRDLDRHVSARRSHSRQETALTTDEPSLEQDVSSSHVELDHLSRTTSDLTQHRIARVPRESNLRYELGVSHSGLTSPMLDVPAAYLSRSPTPVGTPGDDLQTLAAVAAQRAPSPDSSLTPNFAPANGPYHRSALSRADVSRMVDDARDSATPPPETWENLYAPLQRVDHSSPRPDSSATHAMDGLGDRRRSPTPLSESHEEETWTNLLTTLGSPRHSSSATSFASNLHSSVGSNRSSQNTATSFGEIGQGDDSCDLDLPSGITEEDVREIRARHRPDLIPRRTVAAEIGLRTLGDAQSATNRTELIVFQRILHRMQRREEVPDDWWAAVGLSPDVVRGRA